MPDRAQEEEKVRDPLEEAAVIGAKALYSKREWDAMDDYQRGEDCAMAHAILEAALPTLLVGTGSPPSRLTAEEAWALVTPIQDVASPRTRWHEWRASGMEKLRNLAAGGGG